MEPHRAWKLLGWSTPRTSPRGWSRCWSLPRSSGGANGSPPSVNDHVGGRDRWRRPARAGVRQRLQIKRGLAGRVLGERRWNGRRRPRGRLPAAAPGRARKAPLRRTPSRPGLARAPARRCAHFNSAPGCRPANQSIKPRALQWLWRRHRARDDGPRASAQRHPYLGAIPTPPRSGDGRVRRCPITRCPHSFCSSGNRFTPRWRQQQRRGRT